MTAIQTHFGTMMLLLSCAAAQNSDSPATMQNVTTAREGSNLRIEITLSVPVKPSVESAKNPARIVLDFPETAFRESRKSVSVHANGVRRIRTGLHSANPLITRVVIDLYRVQPYVVAIDGNRVTLTVAAIEKQRSASNGAPVAATSGNLIGIFRRKQSRAPIRESTDDSSVPLPPPNTSGAAFEPPVDRSPAIAISPERPSAASQTPSVAVSPANSVEAPSHLPTEIVASKAAELAPSIAAVAPAAVSPAPSVPSPAETPTAPSENSTMIARSDDPSLRTVFKVKYVAEGVAYLEGGRAQGLAEGVTLEIEDTNLPAKQGDSANTADPRVIAELEVTAVAETSAVTDIHAPKRPVKVG